MESDMNEAIEEIDALEAVLAGIVRLRIEA